jgi:hypothetical protein
MHAEPKCKLFSWLSLHGKLLTDNMLAIRGWPDAPMTLSANCASQPQNRPRISALFPFTTAIWKLLRSLEDDGNHLHGQSFSNISEWWDKLIEEKPNKEQHDTSGRLLYVL